MLFNSLDFAVFLPIVFILYWFVVNGNIRVQNLLIVAASYLFYGWWDPRFLLLIMFSTVIDYAVGRGLAKENDKRRRNIFLWVSLIVNLGLLGFFKYYNFFAESFADAFTLFGANIEPNYLSIVLPVGISFYTFQTMSYTIDVYRRKLEPSADFVAFAAFVSFFPQLVAGPIERATNLLPQFLRERTFSYEESVRGLRQVLWGLFKKMVVADNCARAANMIFNDYDNLNGSTLAVGAVFFAFQIYGDFSGYSDIAIGTSRLFGFDLKANFRYPYFSRNIGEFWRRWHISLSTWFRDYLYIPLGGSRVSTLLKVRNVFVIFLVSGFWHGANWTFLAWGGLNALYFLPSLLRGTNRQFMDVPASTNWFPSFRELIGISITFGLTCVAWVFFRSPTIMDAFHYLERMFSSSLLSLPNLKYVNIGVEKALLIVSFFLMEWVGRQYETPLSLASHFRTRALRWLIYVLLISWIILYAGNQQQFIYFQF